jgi:UDP-N-acetylmuramate--alanine ligase
VLLGEVYAAGEAPIVAADGRTLARALRVAGKVEPVFVDDIAAMPQAILDNARAGDVVLSMGAGSIGAVPGKVVELGAAAVTAVAPSTSQRDSRKGRAS